MSIEFACPSCQKTYAVKDDAAGKKAKCGRCGSAIRVPEPEGEGDDFKLAPLPGDDFASDFPSTSLSTDKPLAPITSQNRCPSCDAPLGADAVLCVSCGLNLKTGTQLSTTEVDDDDQPKKKKKRRKKKAGKPDENRGTLNPGTLDPVTLARGTALSLAGVLLGSTLWCAFYHFTGYSFNLIALLVGFLAGAGMSIGHEDDDGTLAGVIAACFALAGIFATKVIIFHMLFGSLGFDPDDETIDRGIVVEQVVNEKLRAQDLIEDTVDEDAYDSLYAEAEEEVAAMSDEQVLVRRKASQLVETLFEDKMDELDEDADEAIYEKHHRDVIEEVESMSADQVQERLNAFQLVDLLFEKKLAELTEDADEATYETLRLDTKAEVAAMTAEQVHHRLAASKIGELSDAADVGFPLIPPLPILFFMFGISGIVLTCIAVGSAYTIASGKMTD